MVTNQKPPKGFFGRWPREGSASRIALPLRWQRVLRLTQIPKAELEAFFKVRMNINC